MLRKFAMTTLSWAVIAVGAEPHGARRPSGALGQGIQAQRVGLVKA
jgi:hypothetical protein